MAWQDTLCFNNSDTVAGIGIPLIDGFFNSDAGVLTDEAEPGYVNGSRMTFGGAGFPPVVFQGVRVNSTNSLVLAFMCRLDLAFDSKDVVTIAIRPRHSVTDQATARRIDIFPNYTGIGADEKHATLSDSPAGTPDDLPPGIPAGNDYHIRNNHTPKTLRFYKGQASGAPWIPFTPSAAVLPNFDVKVRSWVPLSTPFEAAWSVEITIPIDTVRGGADWINILDDFGLYFNVIRLNDNGPNPSQTFSATQFRFPSETPGTTLAGILNETLSIPSSWYGHGLIPALQTPPFSNLGEGVSFVGGNMGVGRASEANAADDPILLGHQIVRKPAADPAFNNALVSLLQNTANVPATNVTATIGLANWGLGSGDFAHWTPPPGLTNPSPAITIPARNPVAPFTSGKNRTINLWPCHLVPVEYAPPPVNPTDKSHQCMWVQLSSNSGVNFVQASVRRNMDFVNLSSHEQEAEVSGFGYPEPKNGTDHDFILMTHCRKILLRELMDNSKAIDPETVYLVTGAMQTAIAAGDDVRRENGDIAVAAGQMMADKQRVAATQQRKWRESVVYLWITQGFRRTGQTLQIDNIIAEVLDEGPGAFGFAAHHIGVADNFSWAFSGRGMAQYRPGLYSLKVPHKGVVSLNLKISAEPDGPSGDVSKDLPLVDHGPKNDPKSGGESGGGKTENPGGCFGLVLALAMIPGLGLATYLTS